MDQQSEASTLGMWVFLATEVMFFGGLITAFAVYRATAPGRSRWPAKQLNVWLGCVNTVVLLAQQPDDGPGRPRVASCERSASWSGGSGSRWSWARLSSASRPSSRPTTITSS